MAALGISIIAPTCMSSLNGMPSRFSFLSHSSSTASARRNSSSPEIIGNMIFTLPDSAGAQDRAQLRFENVGCSRQNRIARQPRKGFNSSSAFDRVGDFVAAEIERANDQRMRRDLFGDLAVGFVLFFFRRQCRRD